MNINHVLIVMTEPKSIFFESIDKFFAIEIFVIDNPIPPGMYLFKFA